MTEDDAKKTACCGSPAVATAILIGRKDVDTKPIQGAEWGMCIASRCAAWRWSEEKRSAAFLEAVQAHMQAQAKPNFNTAVQAVYAESGGKFARTEGGCGLAGAGQ